VAIAVAVAFDVEDTMDRVEHTCRKLHTLLMANISIPTLVARMAPTALLLSNRDSLILMVLLQVAAAVAAEQTRHLRLDVPRRMDTLIHPSYPR
jgi:hypothetical protein